MNIKHLLKNKQELKTLLTIFLEIYLLFSSLVIISIHLYLRFFLERSTITLIELKTSLTFKHYIFFICFIILHFCLLISSIINIFYNKKNPRNKGFVYVLLQKVNNILNIVYWKPLNYIHDKVAPKIPHSAIFFLYLGDKWGNNSRNFFNGLLFIFDILPKIILAIVFTIEISFYGRLHYFIYSLNLVLLPIIFNIFLKLFQSFAERNIPVISFYFDSIKGLKGPQYNEKGEIVRYEEYELIVKPEYSYLNIVEQFNYILCMSRIIDIVVYLKDKQKAILPYVTLITSTAFFIGGLLRLIFLL